MKIFSFTAILCGFVFSFCKAQFNYAKYPFNYFTSPLNIQPPALAGSFGELRANHFHSGIDFRTNQRIGYPIYAPASGYVSRFRVQNSGFGYAVYLNHPNGFTTVYGHLSAFSPKIAKHVEEAQYKLKSYQIDEYPSNLLIPIEKGEIIGYTGNSGSSGGPHLHFEIRDTKTEATINPQLFGIEIPDNIKPNISSLFVYRLNGLPFSEFTSKQYFEVVGSNGSYKLNGVSTINTWGEIGFGIATSDKHNGASGNNGVYSITLLVDDKIIFNSQVEQFNFENSKGINAHIDYPLWMTQKKSVQKSFVEPANPMKIYHDVVNEGRILMNDNKLHKVKYVVKDVKGNESILQFNVQSNPQSIINSPKLPEGQLFSHQKTNEFETENLKVIVPKGTLYNDLNFVYKTQENPIKKSFSALHHIHNNLTPLHTGFELWIKPNVDLAHLASKALIVNKFGIAQGGFFENGFVKATPKNFGSFYIAIDTIAPKITPLNIAKGKNMQNEKRMLFNISDNLSGIKSFDAYVDGEWILMKFDTKTNTLWHDFDGRITQGKHTLHLVVVDLKENNRTYQINFHR